MTVRETIARLRARLEPLYGKGETQAIVRLIFDYLKGWDAVHIFMNEEKELSAETMEAIGRVVRRLEAHEPIQYITGTAPFYGMMLHVDRRVLIPRPETEQLVDMIVDRWGEKDDADVLDICTGSGCIAIALSRNLRFPHITALDLSPDAIDVARENAARLKAEIDFVTGDVFCYEPEASSLDIVVSNPPYVDESERAGMERNVLDYEPAMALFVPDADPLIFYSRIATIAMRGLRSGGMLYFEINPRHADAMRALLEAEGFVDVAIEKDIHNRQRFCRATKR